MDPYALREQLAKLHEELGKVQHVDPHSNQLLAEIMQDIKRLMEQPAATLPPGASSARAYASLPERLERIAVQFEVDHPTLAASSRRLVDLLGKVGL
jgi:hypothetical protein